jgi:hypothetical protein
MATTFADLKNEVYGHVYGYSRDQEQSTYLSSSLTSGATSVSVNDAQQVGRGIVEIDDELMWVLTKNHSANTLTIAPWGRGYLGSTAVSHSTDARVTGNPRFTRLAIARAINETILATYPQLFGVASTDLTWNASQTSYDLPSTADRVLSLTWQLPGPSQEWERILRWREILTATGVISVIIDAGIVPGRTVRVIYAKKTTELTTDAGLLTDTGLAESARDVVVYGALARLLMMAEAGRLQSRAMESSELNEDVPPGSSMLAGRRMQEMYQVRLAEERKRLLERYPPSVHMMR